MKQLNFLILKICRLRLGELVLLYSDGVPEAMNSENLLIDVAGLKKVIGASAHETSAKLIEHINLNLRSFVKSDELQGERLINLSFLFDQTGR